jgi:hypothetical protein
MEQFMKKILALAGTLICASSTAEPLPKPWYQTNLEQYESGIFIQGDVQKNKFGYLKSKNEAALHTSKGNILQNISPPDEWLGRRIRLTAQINTKELYGSANFFMNIDHGNGYKTTGLQPLNKISANSDWQSYYIVLDVPQSRNAEILFGISLLGKGEIYFDNFNFEEVGYDIESTGKAEERRKKAHPANLNFEEKKN